MDDDQSAMANIRRRKTGARSDVPRVVDKIGETIARRFEEFLEM